MKHVREGRKSKRQEEDNISKACKRETEGGGETDGEEEQQRTNRGTTENEM